MSWWEFYNILVCCQHVVNMTTAFPTKGHISWNFHAILHLHFAWIIWKLSSWNEGCNFKKIWEFVKDLRVCEPLKNDSHPWWVRKRNHKRTKIDVHVCTTTIIFYSPWTQLLCMEKTPTTLHLWMVVQAWYVCFVLLYSKNNKFHVFKHLCHPLEFCVQTLIHKCIYYGMGETGWMTANESMCHRVLQSLQMNTNKIDFCICAFMHLCICAFEFWFESNTRPFLFTTISQKEGFELWNCLVTHYGCWACWIG